VKTMHRSWAWPSELTQRGVLGINYRNINLLLAENPRCYYRVVDNKVLTKSICRAHGIHVPETYAVIECFGDLKYLMKIIEGIGQFVVKPASGASGRGVLVVVERKDGMFQTTDGHLLSLRQLRYHVSTALSGLYSLGGRPDHVIIEQRIVSHPIFEDLAVEGTPDIRIIVHRTVPAMAMLRLPTKRSKGRANLHQGAVAAGIDIHTGQTFGGVFLNRAIEMHPDTKAALQGLQIPYWNRILETTKKLAGAIEMGYLGIDILLDALRGPVVLEVNARPGLSVQIANRAGLRSRLEVACGELTPVLI
jgi:alpha-L-glutamate ligase-like protein